MTLKKNKGSRPRHRFFGVRLGQRERTLLMAAPSLGNLAGLLVDAPEHTRSAQQGYLRAASKLSGLELVERAYIPQATRACDPRREKPAYSDGRFWYRCDPTRRHRVRRVYLWATPMGEGIRLVYEHELKNGRPIRWTAKKIDAASRYEAKHWKNPIDQSDAVAHLATRFGEGEPTDLSLGAEAIPSDVCGPEQYSRWLGAIAYARRQSPSLGSNSLWVAAVSVYESDIDDDALPEKAELSTAQAPRKQPLLFSRSELEMVTTRSTA